MTAARDVLWGEATGHAVRAFPVSGRPMPAPFLEEGIATVAERHGISRHQFAQWCDPVAMTGDPRPPAR